MRRSIRKQFEDSRGTYRRLAMCDVMFEWNVLLNLSRGAVTKAFRSLVSEFLL